LFQIAAPDVSSKRLKRRNAMSVIEATAVAIPAEIECILSGSDTYIETLTLKQIEAQPWLTELVINTQLLTAKNPEERRVKARCCIERAQLASLGSAINRFLESAGSSSEPKRR
jgi:hypothetical protein